MQPSSPTHALTIDFRSPIRRWSMAIAAAVALSVTAACGSTTSSTGGGTSAPLPHPTSTSTPVSTSTGSSPDPCALADTTKVQALLGSPLGAPRPSSQMSADGTGLVLNCVFSSSDGSKSVDYVQRQNSGRPKFEQSRSAAGTVVEAGADDAYWIPTKTEILALDGNDLVAILFHGVPVDLSTAESMLARSLTLRDRAH